MRINRKQFESELAIKLHRRLLGHAGCGVTELRIFEPKPLVAYPDSEEATVQLAFEQEDNTSGVYIGVQPRPLFLFDNAPNCWRHAFSKPKPNCACDGDIEFITASFFDIDVVSAHRAKGHPASDKELQQSFETAKLLIYQKELTDNSTICCSGNGHYVLTPIVPIQVDSKDLSVRFKEFCHQQAKRIDSKGIKVDPVYNLSRVMRLMGTKNGKGQALQDRPHRRAHFVTEPILDKSMALHHIIVNVEIPRRTHVNATFSGSIRCELSKIEACQFIKWCRSNPTKVTEPQWFAMITNLAQLEGGPKLIHQISSLDMFRYDCQQTQRTIERVLDGGYGPIKCNNLMTAGFICSKATYCSAKAPMYMTALYTKYR